jgi:hypothetical protein
MWHGTTFIREIFPKSFVEKSMSTNDDIEKGDARTTKRKERRIYRLAARLRNNSPGRDPSLEVPLKVLMPLTIVVAPIYCLARGYILVADIISLRSVPPSAFETVNWMQFWPWNLS